MYFFYFNQLNKLGVGSLQAGKKQ